MAITLGTNTTSYVARVSLDSTSKKLSNSMQRIATGLKINKAGDDAAGLVISENMKAYIRSSKQAMANIQNAEAYLTVADDGMVAIADHLQRINDLLTSMANDTNDEDARQASLNEINERLKEIDRLADSTNFNGRTMLDGKTGKIVVQMGPDETDNSTLDISKALTDCHLSALGATLIEELDPSSEKYKLDGDSCRKYMKVIQDAINQLSTQRGLLGAFENRMESSYNSLTTRIESLETARALYTDTDIAETATDMVQQQILQQLNTSILASANSLQAIALSLLGG